MTEVTSYTELIAGIDAQRQELGVRHLDFEVLTGMTQGHWGKATGMLQVKKLGIEKIFDALRAAGLRMKLEIDPEQCAKMRARIEQNFNPMQLNQARASHAASTPSSAVLTRVFKAMGRRGGEVRWRGKSQKDRSAHMRMMALAKAKADRKRRKAMQQKRMREKQRRAAGSLSPDRATAGAAHQVG